MKTGDNDRLTTEVNLLKKELGVEKLFEIRKKERAEKNKDRYQRMIDEIKENSAELLKESSPEDIAKYEQDTRVIEVTNSMTVEGAQAAS